jgi:cytochrome P450
MREQDPVLRQPGLDGETPIWFITRHDDVAAVLLDDERFVRDPRLAMTPEQIEATRMMPPGMEMIENHMLNRDGDDHRRLRRLVTTAFTPKRVEQLRPRIQAIADELLDAVEARGEMDLSAEYAFPLPITVIAELLGVPTADQDRFKEWSDAIISPALDPKDLERFFERMGEFVGYLTDFFAQRRAAPTDDLVSGLLAAQDESDALSEQEVFGTVVLLIVAGHETTVGLIGNAVLNLLEHPDQLALLQQDPTLIPGAIEEVLRYEGPVERSLNRWAATDVELGGQTIRKGDLVIPILTAAGRDPTRFPEPDRLDVTREDTRHVAFGRGSHYCLGAPLARLETEIALETLFRRLPELRLAVPRAELEWRPTPGFRRVVALPVAW